MRFPVFIERFFKQHIHGQQQQIHTQEMKKSSMIFRIEPQLISSVLESDMILMNNKKHFIR